MRCGCDDELFQAWKDGKIRNRKDLPEEGVAMTTDLCEEVASGARAVCAHQRCAACGSPPRPQAPLAARARSRP